MKRPLSDTAPAPEGVVEAAITRLTEEVHALERRVRALEDGTTPAPAGFQPAVVDQPPVESLPSVPPGLIQVFGQGILGIGGAYLLRAAAESGSLPGLTGVTAALAYTVLWLFFSARAPRGHEAAGIVFAGTAALVFAPMLWETTVRFKILPPLAAALLVTAFAISGAAVAWLRDQPGVVWATALPGGAAATALMVGTGEIIPFAISLLAICAITETVAVRDRWLSIRPWMALLADSSVLLATRIAALPQVESYRHIPPVAGEGLALALCGIYAGSIGYRTIKLDRRITLFEIAQLGAVYALAFTGLRWLTHAPSLVGAACLLLGSGSYAVALRQFDAEKSRRDHHVYCLQGLAFLLTGTALVFSASTAAVLWCGIAIGAQLVARRRRSFALPLHGTSYLVASAMIAGLPEFGRAALTGSTAPEPQAAAFTVTIAAIASYVACKADALKWVRLVIASVAVFGCGAFLVTLVAYASPAPLSAPWLAVVRTFIGSGMALALGFASYRWKRAELIWIGYSVVGALTLKLFWEDFRHDSPAALALSLLCYGAVLLLGPRLIRSGPRRP